MSEAIFLLLATYFAHSTALLAMAWGIERAGLARNAATQELLWRFALFAGIATAAAQFVWPVLDANLVGLARTSAKAEVASGAPVAASLPSAGAALAARGAERALPGPSRDAGVALRKAWTLPSAAGVFAPWLAGAWLLAGVAGALWLAFAVSRRRAALARLAPCNDVEALAIVRRICRARGLREPRVVDDPDSCSPTANIGGVLTLPPWALRSVGSQGLEAMLAHELGHFARRDTAWRLAAALVRALLWFQPLNAFAARRLDALAESAADSWAVDATGKPRALAECLAHFATHIGNSRAPALAIAMAGGSRLFVRIQHLLQESPMQAATVRPFHRLLVAIALLLAVMLLPVVAIAPVSAGRSAQIETSDSLFGGKYTKVRIDEDGLALSAEIRGDIRFSAAEDDVVALGDGDEAWIEQVVDGVKRRIEFEQNAGKLERRYFVDGRAQALDAAGRAWLRTAIPVLFREAGIDAEARAKRIHARGGASAVLDEIALIHGNHVRRIYLQSLAGIGPMVASELDRAIALAGGIESDFEQRESLSTLLETQKFGPAQQIALLGVVAGMKSDFEQRNVLARLAPALSDEPAVGAAWAGALDTMGSSFERREALGRVAARDTVGAGLVGHAFAAISGMDSDFEKRTALAAFAVHVERNPQLAARYAATTRNIDSNFERREALLALLEGTAIDVVAARAVLDAAAEMDSDFEKRQVLTAVASRMPEDAGLIARYREIARGMSDFERGQAEKALDRFAGWGWNNGLPRQEDALCANAEPSFASGTLA